MAKDTLRSQANISFVDLLCEGEIVGLVDGAKSIYMNDTQLQNSDGTYNFDDVSWEQRFGTNDQSSLSLIKDVENEINVNAQLTKVDGAVTRTITNADATNARVKIRLPALFTQADNGDVNGASVQIKFEIQENGNGYKPCIVGAGYSALGVTNVTSLHEQCSNYATKIQGTALITGSFAGTDEGADYYNEFTYQVQYRAIGASTWITYKTQSVGVQYGAFEESFTIDKLVSNTYEVRINVTSGTGVTGELNCNFYQGINYDTITGKASDGYERDYEITLNGSAPWNIRLTRLTNDSTSLKLANDTYWSNYTIIIAQKFRYPNSALIGIKYDSKAFSNTPARGYDVKLKKIQVPSNYDPIRKLYYGIWDGTFATSWSDNPAWCFYDLVTNSRYGLGNYITSSQIDKWTLYTIGKYCDEQVDNGKGGTEARFTCNLYLQTRAEAFKVLNDFVSIFRSMVYWSNGTITFGQDSPRDPVALFSPANVLDGSFTYAGSSAKTRHTVAIVTWNDPENNYKQAVEYVEDKDGIARYGIVQSEVTAMGCTSQGQARRVGKWLLYTDQNENETVAFSTGVEGLTVRPNDIINVQDPTRAGVRNSGRISTATTTEITVDADFTLPTSSTMFVSLPSGAIESKTVLSKTGKVITLSSALSETPQSGSMWMIDAPSVEAQTFRVISVTEGKDGNVDISALKYDANKYAYIEDGEPLPARDYSNITVGATAPSTIATEEALYSYQAEVRSKLTISYSKGTNASEYRIDWRKDLNNFTTIYSSDTDVEILNTSLGSYEIRVWSINAINQQSPTYATITVDVLGKTAPPSDITTFTNSIDANIGVTLYWTDIADLDLAYYEIRNGETWETATFVAKTKASYYKVGNTKLGTQTYLIKAIDTSESYSTTAASTTASIAQAIAPTVDSNFEIDTLALSWLPVEGTLATVSYEIRYGASWAAGTVLGKVNTTYFRTKINWLGARNFFVASIDIAGNYGAIATKVVTTVAPLNATSLNYSFTDTSLTSPTVTLTWVSPTVIHGLNYYEVTYDSIVTTVNANTITLPASWTGTKVFTIKTVDLVGNKSTGATLSATLYVPNAPTASTPYVSQNQLYLKWVAPAKTSLPIWGYEVRKDLNWGNDTNLMFKGTSLQCAIPTDSTDAGINNFYVKTIDTENNYSSSYLTFPYTVALPTAVTDLVAVFSDTSLTSATVNISWATTSAVFGVDYYEISYGTVTTRVKGNSITFPADWVGSRTFSIKVIDTLGQISSTYSEAFTLAVPSAPPSASTFVSQSILNLSWTNATQTTLPIWGYEVRSDTNFGTTGYIFKGNSLSCAIPKSLTVLGVNNYYIKTIDTDNNYSSTYLTASYTVASPTNIVDFTTDFRDSSLTSATVTLEWLDVATPFDVEHYLVSYDLVSIKVQANTITLPADWVGSRTYTIKTVDYLGNQSTGYSESVTKLAPNAPNNFRAQVIDNNVLFYWDLPTRTTLPISHVLLKKGTTWATAEIIGTKSGAFTSLQEQVGGDYIYWIATVDTDEVESAPVSIATTVAEPPDFIFNGDFTSNFGGTKSSAISEEGALIIPVNTTETWADHFSTRGWTSPADQITAGFPIYIQPTLGTGYYEEVFDYGNILASSKINVEYTGTIVAGTPTIVCSISISADNITYTTYNGVSSIYASNFRYVKIRITVNQTLTTAIYKLESLYARLDAKQINDADSKACLSTDTLGTIANFNKEFVDITSINVTPSGTTSTTAVYDFQDAILTSTYAVATNVCTVTATAHGLITGQNVRLYFSSGTAPSGVYTVISYTANTFTVAITTGNTSGNCLTYPQGFRIYLFNSAGTRVSGTASWAVRGY